MAGTKGQQDLSLGSLGPSRAELVFESVRQMIALSYRS